MPAASRQRRGSLTMFFMPILRSVRRPRAGASAAAEAAAYFAGS